MLNQALFLLLYNIVAKNDPNSAIAAAVNDVIEFTNTAAINNNAVLFIGPPKSDPHHCS